MRTLNDMDIKGKRVLVRVDFNVPIKDGEILDGRKLEAAVPTVKKLLGEGAKQIILMSHLGRPKGEVVEDLRMKPVGEAFSKILGRNVAVMQDCVSVDLPDDQIILLENLRFYKAEKENDEGFARGLSEYGDMYVNDAFGTCHREHASMHAITRFLPGCVGLLVQKEIDAMKHALEDPEHPLVAIIGGKKIHTKIEMVEHFKEEADTILIGGGMIFTFYKAKGLPIGKSVLYEEDIPLAKDILEKLGDTVVLPSDVVVAPEASENASATTVTIPLIPEDQMGLDIGPETVDYFKERLRDAKTIIWNGPLGVFEIEQFAEGSRKIAEFVASRDAYKVIGGGETADMIHEFGLDEKMSHISTGGGASLQLLSGEPLPALEALKENENVFP